VKEGCALNPENADREVEIVLIGRLTPNCDPVDELEIVKDRFGCGDGLKAFERDVFDCYEERAVGHRGSWLVTGAAVVRWWIEIRYERARDERDATASDREPGD